MSLQERTTQLRKIDEVLKIFIEIWRIQVSNLVQFNQNVDKSIVEGIGRTLHQKEIQEGAKRYKEEIENVMKENDTILSKAIRISGRELKELFLLSQSQTREEAAKNKIEIIDQKRIPLVWQNQLFLSLVFDTIFNLELKTNSFKYITSTIYNSIEYQELDEILKNELRGTFFTTHTCFFCEDLV